MKRLSLVSAIAVAIMLVTLLVPSLAPSVKAPQPPVDTTTMYVGTIGWGPRRADPVRAYDTGSGELIFNVYDTLIFTKGELYWEFEPRLAIEWHKQSVTVTIRNDSVNLNDPRGKWRADTVFNYECLRWQDRDNTGDLSVGDGMIVEKLDTGEIRVWTVKSLALGPPVEVTLEIVEWKFKLRLTDAGGNPIHFVDESGAIVDDFDPGDAEYSFKRGLVQDQYGSPMWMFYKPLFGEMNSDPWDTGDPADAYELANLIEHAVEIIDGDTLKFNLGHPFPDIAWQQILSQTWGSIVSKQFSVSIGCWDGDLYTDGDGDGYPDWFTTIRHASRSPYDKTATIPRPPGVTFTNGYRYAGTGPYRVITFDAVNCIVELVKNDHYWGGWDPFPGYDYTPVRNHLEKIVIRYIADWPARKAAFLAGDIDVCAVPRANMFELLDPLGNPIVPGIVTIKNISPALSMDANHYTFTVDPTSTYIAKRKDTGEELPNFFNNTHVRKAFSYAFNHTMFIKDAWFNEAIWRNNMLVYGLVPDYYDPTCGGYDINVAKAIEELQAVVFSDGKTLYEAGFTLGLAYNSGNDQRRIACEMLQAFFQGLGSQFAITIYEIDWPTYLDLFETFQLPIWSIGWLADFADADNFARPYMHSWGDFAYFQNYTYWNGWGTRKDQVIDMALLAPDGPARAALYKELQTIYYNDAPFLPLNIPIGRRWCWYWVKGWYYNALYPAQYYYSMYKEDTCWYNISGPTLGVPDDVTNMRDVNYLILFHFNAKAPEPGKPPDPKWVGTYGFGGVDPSGDRVCNMKDATFLVLQHFNHRNVP